MGYMEIHKAIHTLESLIAQKQNMLEEPSEELEKALDVLRHQVAEWIRTAEKHKGVTE